MLRVVDFLEPSAIFFENVSAVLHMAMDEIANRLYFDRGYELRWACVSAVSLGAPHKRERWFCLASKSGFRGDLLLGCTYAAFDWNMARAPTRHVRHEAEHIHYPSAIARLGLLGNSVVPDAVRFAFFTLATGFKTVRVDQTSLGMADIPDTMIRSSFEEEMAKVWLFGRLWCIRGRFQIENPREVPTHKSRRICGRCPHSK
jgi:hypothetical protein